MMVSIDINHATGIVPARDPTFVQTQDIMIRATDELKIRLSWLWEQDGRDEDKVSMLLYLLRPSVLQQQF